MKIFPRFIPPAGTNIKFNEIFGWLFDTLIGVDRRPELCNKIKLKYHINHCFLMSSGRAAMAMIFQILKQKNKDKNRYEIVLPSYTCYSVPAAVEISGLTVRICDIDPKTLSYDLQQFEKIDFSHVLCVVTANLYGYPNDLPKIEAITNKNGCYLLDDAAQSMNAKIGNKFSGTFGDIGLYSLDKGKNITSLQGGILVTNNDELATEIDKSINNLPVATFKQQFTDAVKLIIYSLLLKPWLYWIPANIPALGLGKTIYTTDYLYTQYSRSMSALAVRLFDRIDDITKERKNITEKIFSVLKNIEGVRFIELTDKETEPAYLRAVVFIKNKDKRNIIIDELRNNGISATTSYPQSIAELEQIKEYSVTHENDAENGKNIAQHIITLPSIASINSDDVNNIDNIFSKHSATK